jgi:hypothetical protein
VSKTFAAVRQGRSKLIPWSLVGKYGGFDFDFCCRVAKNIPLSTVHQQSSTHMTSADNSPCLPTTTAGYQLPNARRNDGIAGK